VTTATRSRMLPDVPTVDEAAGTRGYETSVMYGVWAPAQTPQAVVIRLNTEIVQAARSPALADKLAAQGIEAAKPHSPVDMAAYIREQAPKWAKLVRDSGAKADGGRALGCAVCRAGRLARGRRYDGQVNICPRLAASADR